MNLSRVGGTTRCVACDRYAAKSNEIGCLAMLLRGRNKLTGLDGPQHTRRLGIFAEGRTSDSLALTAHTLARLLGCVVVTPGSLGVLLTLVW